MAQLNLNKLIPLIEEMPAYRQLLDLQKKGSVRVSVPDAAKPYLLAALFGLGKPMLVVTAQPENSKSLYEQITTWCPSGEVKLFPEPDALPYQRISTDPSTEQERLQALFALCGVDKEQGVPLIVTSAPALMQKIMPYKDFISACHTISVGTEIEPLHLLARWESIGYNMENVVEVPGTMSRRGGIIDIFSPSGDLPARLEFLGNTIDSIRLFDPANQRSVKPVASISVSPATEMLTASSKEDRQDIDSGLDLSNCTIETREQMMQELEMLGNRQKPENVQFYAPMFNTDSLLSYLPSDALLVIDEPALVKQTAADLDEEAEELRKTRVESGELPANFPRPYFTWEELEPQIKATCLALSSFTGAEDEVILRLDFAPAPTYAGQLPVFIEKVKQLKQQKRRVIVISHQASRLSELLDEDGIIAQPLAEVSETPPHRSITLLQGSLAQGWSMSNDTYLFTDAEIFGFVKERRLSRKRPVPRHKLTLDISPGAYVVHIEHGIAKFSGVTTMATDTRQKEYLVLSYAAGDKLYVPTDQIDRVSRYIGPGDQPPTLSRLGTQEWSRTRQRVKEAVEEIARDLLQLYASREVVPGFAFSIDNVWQQELEASFPYVETADQVKAIKEVKEDMTRPKPMDRLVCGDVGYGKTEIAIRAAFKAVLDGKQVAILVPTTVLAQQHYSTFMQRLGAFPVKLEVLSRFRTSKEQQAVVDGLARGAVDICIGTHRLLQKDVVFKDLGLLIIDEEQRFGVTHKEFLKKMRREVDVLTLSATPIPRTLYISLVGVRDMSCIETPPEERLPIKTYVAEYNERLVREAILKEMERNGQVFFLHNRVQSIDYMASKLGALVPEARIAIGHGQLAEAQLEKVMSDFATGEYDVLVCTTIIESGLDMPNVNTLIVNKADRFGLTQLYQLRGRIGRGANLAYAYFLYDREKRLTPAAEKRLKTIYEATELGAGFGIAMKDLEIRGAGTLLGTRQSGHIGAVGFSLYTKLLAEAVEELKDKKAGVEKPEKRLPPPTIDLPLAAYIPEYYVEDLETRLSLYQKLADLESGQLESFTQELNDRFGAPPAEVKNLLYAVKIKALATKARIESISTLDSQIIMIPAGGVRFNPPKLEPLFKDGVRVYSAQIRISTKRLGRGWMKMLEEVLGRVG